MIPRSPAESDPPGPRWYAIHSRSRHERKVAAELDRLGQEVFLPEYQTWSRRRDRRKQVKKNLFPGYLFVRARLTPEVRLAILQAPSVVRIVGIRHQPVPIPDDEVESVRLLLGVSEDAEPLANLVAGKKVQVMQGPLRGVIGRVASSGRGKRIVVSVELLGRSVAATLDTDALVPYLDA
jgi:transcription antitermination factor NusG